MRRRRTDPPPPDPGESLLARTQRASEAAVEGVGATMAWHFPEAISGVVEPATLRALVAAVDAYALSWVAANVPHERGEGS